MQHVSSTCISAKCARTIDEHHLCVDLLAAGGLPRVHATNLLFSRTFILFSCISQVGYLESMTLIIRSRMWLFPGALGEVTSLPPCHSRPVPCFTSDWYWGFN